MFVFLGNTCFVESGIMFSRRIFYYHLQSNKNTRGVNLRFKNFIKNVCHACEICIIFLNLYNSTISFLQDLHFVMIRHVSQSLIDHFRLTLVDYEWMLPHLHKMFFLPNWILWTPPVRLSLELQFWERHKLNSPTSTHVRMQSCRWPVIALKRVESFLAAVWHLSSCPLHGTCTQWCSKGMRDFYFCFNFWRKLS